MYEQSRLMTSAGQAQRAKQAAPSPSKVAASRVAQSAVGKLYQQTPKHLHRGEHQLHYCQGAPQLAIINSSCRKRIAVGSGTSVQEVNNVLPVITPIA